MSEQKHYAVARNAAEATTERAIHNLAQAEKIAKGLNRSTGARFYVYEVKVKATRVMMADVGLDWLDYPAHSQDKEQR